MVKSYAAVDTCRLLLALQQTVTAATDMLHACLHFCRSLTAALICRLVSSLQSKATMAIVQLQQLKVIQSLLLLCKFQLCKFQLCLKTSISAEQFPYTMHTQGPEESVV